MSLHLALGAAIWGLLVAGALVGWYARAGRVTVDGRSRRRAPGLGRAVRSATPRRARHVRDRVSAYVALTKPRIIELLLVTTLPAMVLAWSTVRGHGPRSSSRGSRSWTLVGGTLAAGAANAINCYLDRDIDEIMVAHPPPAAAGPPGGARGRA